MTMPRSLRTLVATAAFAAALVPSAFAATPLSQEAQDALAAGIADEYRAEAFYAAVIEKFGEVRPFVNIIRAEQTHSAALTAVMQTYGIDPGANTLLGDPAIAASVPATLAEACAIGVQAEMDNQNLYDGKLIPATADYPDIRVVFENLRDASQNNHLPAFQRCAVR